MKMLNLSPLHTFFSWKYHKWAQLFFLNRCGPHSSQNHYICCLKITQMSVFGCEATYLHCEDNLWHFLPITQFKNYHINRKLDIIPERPCEWDNLLASIWTCGLNNRNRYNPKDKQSLRGYCITSLSLIQFKISNRTKSDNYDFYRNTCISI